MTLDTNLPEQTIPFGNLSIPVSAHTLRAECPMRARVLCDGTVQHYLLTDADCTLTLSGSMPFSDGMALCRALRTAMLNHTAERFVFAGTLFTGMQVIGLAYSSAKHKMLTEYTVTLHGTMTEAFNP
ncbi:MAG: hypothetical protein IKQ39_02905 [Oscillospiraceae bacterium]|nr:hypothetical protein [Oscillospiraceae bacterium]